MLFRPFKPHWYTLGWQGIIPRTRSVLAHNVAKVVGERLVTMDEIENTLNSPEVKGAIAASIYKNFTNYDDPGAKQELLQEYFDKIAVNIAENLIASKDLRRSVDTFAAKIARKALSAVLKLDAATVKSWANNAAGSDSALILGDRLRAFIEKKSKSSIHAFIYSGKSVSELLPDMINTAELARELTAQLMPMLKELFSRRDIASRVGAVLIEYKNEQFSGMKLSAVNMFLGDDKITELAYEKVPEIGSKIVQDSGVRASITQVVENKLNEFLNKPLSSFAEAMGDRYYTILHYAASAIATKAVPSELSSLISELNPAEGATLGEILGIDADDIIPQQLRLSSLLISSDAGKQIRGMISGNISNIALTPGQLTVFSNAAAGWVLQIIKSLVPHALRLININRLVEDKINSLELRDVEDMLFSFMRSHFKWINILGFVIGFLVGCGQVAFMLLNERFIP